MLAYALLLVVLVLLTMAIAMLCFALRGLQREVLDLNHDLQALVGMINEKEHGVRHINLY
jgi:predicted Holliday junction resolvase-like endonuclease